MILLLVFIFTLLAMWLFHFGKIINPNPKVTRTRYETNRFAQEENRFAQEKINLD